MKKAVALALSLALILCCLCACTSKTGTSPAPTATQAPVTLTVAGSFEDFPAMETMARLFHEKYPNVTVQYEYLQNFSETVLKRMDSAEDKIDLFVCNNIQSDSAYYPYALDLYAQGDAVDLSGTYEGLIKNAEFRATAEGEKTQLYSVPFGAEVRGMYVNKTLLSSVGLSVPTTVSEFLNCCEVLKEHGYIAVMGNPGILGPQLMYPVICNIIANAADYQAIYDRVEKCEAGVNQLFEEPMQLMYTLMANDYYKYKYVETEYSLFTNIVAKQNAYSFLNIVKDGETYVKRDDVGLCAFFPATISLESDIAKAKEDCHSAIEYEFILAPVTEEGGYAYMSPSGCIAVNKNSDNAEWAVKFLNFLFQPDNNKVFASEYHIIPNTADALSLATSQFNIPSNRVSQLGQVTFTYDFYTTVTNALVNISKGNNPKYMQDNGDGTTSLYPFSYYMEQLEASFAALRKE